MQVLMGLEYIHSKHIVHRLLSARNVYLNHQGDLKIGAFGSAKLLEDTLQKAVTLVTAPCNMSPEMVRGEAYNGKADIWALGCLVFEIAALRPPYQFASLPQLYDLIVERPPPELPLRYANHLAPIYRKMMRKAPAQRPSAAELLQEEVFVELMREYTKKHRIDALDLRYLVPKRLALHRTREPRKDRLKLPPIAPSSPAPLAHKHTPHRKNKMEGSCAELRTQSKERRKESREKKGEEDRRAEEDERGEEEVVRLTKIDEQAGAHISSLYEAKLGQILLKYKPNLSQIYEQTFEFDETINK